MTVSPTRPALLLVCAALAGCMHATTVPVNLVSRAEFPPAERDAVWSRALTSMHEAGLLAEVEGAARFATTGILKGKTTCRKWSCDVAGTLQVVVTPAGVLSARYDRVFSGEVGETPSATWERLLVEEDVARLQLELDAWVATVVGGVR